MEFTTPTSGRARGPEDFKDPGMEGMKRKPDQNSMATAVDRVDHEIGRYMELLEELHHKLLPVLTSYPSPTAGEDTRNSTEDGASDLQNTFLRMSDRLAEHNDVIRQILGRIDL